MPATSQSTTEIETHAQVLHASAALLAAESLQDDRCDTPLQRVNVGQFLEEVRGELRHQVSAALSIHVSVADPALEADLDCDAVRRSLTNLVRCADQPGRASVNVLLHGHRFGDLLHLCVTDDGPGLPMQLNSSSLGTSVSLHYPMVMNGVTNV